MILSISDMGLEADEDVKDETDLPASLLPFTLGLGRGLMVKA